jgi:hypothetical protein
LAGFAGPKRGAPSRDVERLTKSTPM